MVLAAWCAVLTLGLGPAAAEQSPVPLAPASPPVPEPPPPAPRSVRVVAAVEPFSPFLSGYSFVLGGQLGRNQLAVNLSRIELPGIYNSQKDDFDVNRRYVELAYSRFVTRSVPGLHVGLAIGRIYKETVTPKLSSVDPAQSRDFWRVGLRVGYYWYPFKRLGLFIEPQFTFGFAFGDEDLDFGTKRYNAKALDISGPSFNVGWRY